MDATEFVSNYESFVKEIGSVVKSELFPVVEELLDKDPHDLITPNAFFQSKASARGFVWTMFLQEARKAMTA